MVVSGKHLIFFPMDVFPPSLHHVPAVDGAGERWEPVTTSIGGADWFGLSARGSLAGLARRG